MAEEKKSNKPKVYLVLKIIGAILAVVGVVVLIVGLTMATPEMSEEGWFESSASKMVTTFCGVALLMFSVFLLFIGFIPEIQKTQIKTTRHVVNATSDDLKDITSTTADIAGEGIEKVTRSVKKGLSNEDVKYCTKCGASMPKDSKFCPSCGESQE